MNDYNPNHFKFVRNSHSRRSEFEQEPDAKLPDKIVAVLAIIIMMAVLLIGD